MACNGGQWCEPPAILVSLQRRFTNDFDLENENISSIQNHLPQTASTLTLISLILLQLMSLLESYLIVQVGSDVKLQLQGLQAARALNVAVGPPPGSPWHVLPVKLAEPVALELHVKLRARPRKLLAPRPAVEQLDLRQYGGSCCAEPCASGGRHKRWGELRVC